MFTDIMKKSLRIMLFKETPEVLPPSAHQFFLLIFILYLTRVFTELPVLSRMTSNHGALGELIVTALNFIVFYLVVFVVLLAGKKATRFLPAAIALVAVNIIFFIFIFANSAILYLWTNLVSLVGNHSVLNFSFDYLIAIMNNLSFALEPILLFIIMPHIYAKTLSTSFRKGILISALVALATLCVEGMVIRWLIS
ncbi:MAG: hypothetical protein KIT27_01570 [Legionellales bacterium]|nr:hypothetical protein [Legionellales bacterium]